MSQIITCMYLYNVRLQVDKSPSVSSAIDLVLTDSVKVENVPVLKPKLSQKAWNRLSNRNRRKVNPGGSGSTPQPKESSPSPPVNDTGRWSCGMSCDLGIQCMYIYVYVGFF